MLRTGVWRCHPCCFLLERNLFEGCRLVSRPCAVRAASASPPDSERSRTIVTSEFGFANPSSKTYFLSRKKDGYVVGLACGRKFSNRLHFDNFSRAIWSMDCSCRRYFADDRVPPGRHGSDSNDNRDPNFYRQTRIRLKKTQTILHETRDRVKEKVEEMITRETILTVPNVLCGIRVLLSPVISYFVLKTNFELALGLFVFAGITDLMDGYIARNFRNQQTMFGSFLDPLADKLLIFFLMLSLTYRDMIPVPLTALVLLRDALLIGAGFYVRYISLPPPKTLSRYLDVTMVTARLKPTNLSKANTAVQLTLVATTLTMPLLPCDLSPYIHYMWYFTAATTVLSVLSYATSKDTYELVRKFKKAKTRDR